MIYWTIVGGFILFAFARLFWFTVEFWYYKIKTDRMEREYDAWEHQRELAGITTLKKG